MGAVLARPAHLSDPARLLFLGNTAIQNSLSTRIDRQMNTESQPYPHAELEFGPDVSAIHLPVIADLIDEAVDIHQLGINLTNHLDRDSVRDDLKVRLRFLDEAGRCGVVARNLWRRGYYIQAVEVGRSIFELWLASEWVRLRPAHGAKYLNNPKHQPRFKDMINALKPEWSNLLDHVYGFASSWAHPSFYVASHAARNTQPQYEEVLAKEVGSGLVAITGQAFLPFVFLSAFDAGLVGSFYFGERATVFHQRVQQSAINGYV